MKTTGRRSVMVAVSVAVLLALTSGGVLAAPAVLDQQQTADSWTQPFSTSDSFYLAQTFTAGMTGQLVMVSLEGISASNVSIEIAEANADIPGADITGTSHAMPGGWSDFTLGDPVDVVNGHRYAIRVALDPVALTWLGTCDAGSSYSGGRALVFESGNWLTVPAWATANGKDPGVYCGLDFTFKTYVLPAIPVPASADLDQSNGPSPSFDRFMSTTNDLAQTFTAGKSGSLTCVDLYMSGSGSDPVTVKIENLTPQDRPDGTPIASATATPSATAGWVAFCFASPPSVTSGNPYAIVFNTGENNTAEGSRDTYSGGEAYVFDGSTWNHWDTGQGADHRFCDWAFATYVRAAAPTAPPTTTGVADASDEPGGTIWLLPTALFALFGGLFVLLARRRASGV